MKTYKVPYVYEVSGTLHVYAKNQKQAEKIVEQLLDDGLDWPTQDKMIIFYDDIGHRDYFTY